MGVLVSLVGCEKPESAQWLLNGWCDPTQVGQFREPRRSEIRSVLSILEEPEGIQKSEEPAPRDLEPEYADQKISPGDVVNISIFELLNPSESATQQVRVTAAGFETIPVIGRIRVAGLTPRELELELKERLRTAQILEDAEVQVTLVETRLTQFSILGSVQRPGTYALPTPEYRPLNALAEAGGVAPQIDKVYVFRRWGGAGLVAPSDEGPTTKPDGGSGPASFTLSEGSPSSASAPSSMTSSAKTPATEPARPRTSETPVDELKILEGASTRAAPVPRWDPEKMEWVFERPPSAPAAPEGESAPPGSLARLARTTSKAAGEEKPGWESPEELSSATRILEIPLKELLDGDPRYNVVIRPFDLINVPTVSVGEYYLMGNIARPGAYELTGRKLTVKESIAAGGGFGPLAWPSRADLVRRIGKDEEQMIQLDLDAIFAGNAPDFYLKPNDIVNIGTHPVATFLAVLRNAFRLSYGFGFVYDRNFADADSPQIREQAKSRRLQEAQIRGIPIR